MSIRHRARSLSVRLDGMAGPAEDGEREGGGLLVGGGGGASKESPPEASESESETSEEEEVSIAIISEGSAPRTSSGM